MFKQAILSLALIAGTATFAEDAVAAGCNKEKCGKAGKECVCGETCSCEKKQECTCGKKEGCTCAKQENASCGKTACGKADGSAGTGEQKQERCRQGAGNGQGACKRQGQ